MQSNELRMSKVVKIRYIYAFLMGNILLKIKRDYFNITHVIEVRVLSWFCDICYVYYV